MSISAKETTENIRLKTNVNVEIRIEVRRGPVRLLRKGISDKDAKNRITTYKIRVTYRTESGKGLETVRNFISVNVLEVPDVSFRDNVPRKTVEEAINIVTVGIGRKIDKVSKEAIIP